MGKVKRIRKMKSARKMARKWSQVMTTEMYNVFCIHLEVMRSAICSRNIADKLEYGGYAPKIVEPVKIGCGDTEIVLPNSKPSNVANVIDYMNEEELKKAQERIDVIIDGKLNNKPIKVIGCTISVSDNKDVGAINTIKQSIQSDCFCNY